MSNIMIVFALILVACMNVKLWYFSTEEYGICLFVAGVCIGFAMAVVWNPWEKNYKKLLKLLEINLNQLQ